MRGLFSKNKSPNSKQQPLALSLYKYDLVQNVSSQDWVNIQKEPFNGLGLPRIILETNR